MRPPNEPVDVFKFITMRGQTECWPWTGTWGGPKRERRPYFSVRNRRYIASRIVYELSHGPIPDKQLILHSCDNGSYPVGCCNPAHMRAGTSQENMDDMTDRQRHGLPHRVVRAIRRMINDGRRQQDIADLYGISREVVSHIANYRTYVNIPLVGDDDDDEQSTDTHTCTQVINGR